MALGNRKRNDLGHSELQTSPNGAAFESIVGGAGMHPCWWAVRPTSPDANERLLVLVRPALSLGGIRNRCPLQICLSTAACSYFKAVVNKRKNKSNYLFVLMIFGIYTRWIDSTGVAKRPFGDADTRSPNGYTPVDVGSWRWGVARTETTVVTGRFTFDPWD
jgi:hypothetical protein